MIVRLTKSDKSKFITQCKAFYHNDQKSFESSIIKHSKLYCSGSKKMLWYYAMNSDNLRIYIDWLPPKSLRTIYRDNFTNSIEFIVMQTGRDIFVSHYFEFRWGDFIENVTWVRKRLWEAITLPIFVFVWLMIKYL